MSAVQALPLDLEALYRDCRVSELLEALDRELVGLAPVKTRVREIEILLQAMENQRDDLVVIPAGYKDRMERFFASNPGMASRIAHHIDFPDYSPQDIRASRVFRGGAQARP